MGKLGPAAPAAANDTVQRARELSPRSKEIIVGIVGYAGAGCSTAAERLSVFLGNADYKVHKVRLSQLICDHFEGREIPKIEDGVSRGTSKLKRSMYLQDLGDELRLKYKNFAVAALGVNKIIELRGGVEVGSEKIAYVVDSIKHKDEVEFLRDVYGEAFRLVAVHGEGHTRRSRLVGNAKSTAKYAGASVEDVEKYIERDEKDGLNKNGQQVRDAFYLADYFLDNNVVSSNGSNLNDDIDRFVNLFLGAEVVRPTLSEKSMFYAYAASRQSSCLSRQVGAVLVSEGGEVIGTGMNEVPEFGGGVYTEDSSSDARCHTWKWTDGEVEFVGCHNDRKKSQLRRDVADWFDRNFSAELALAAHPKNPVGNDLAENSRIRAQEAISRVLNERTDLFDDIPRVKDLIEFSRAIHAEMSAILAASRSGSSTLNSRLFCTTYPCHNCARHMVSAGVREVFYVEPYVKSLATELHSESITSSEPKKGEIQSRMVVRPFVGVGPRMYEDFFTKRGVLKAPDGSYLPPAARPPVQSVRLLELGDVEGRAAKLVPAVGA